VFTAVALSYHLAQSVTTAHLIPADGRTPQTSAVQSTLNSLGRLDAESAAEYARYKAISAQIDLLPKLPPAERQAIGQKLLAELEELKVLSLQRMAELERLRGDSHDIRRFRQPSIRRGGRRPGVETVP
jgi:hypothetical protein